MTDELKRLRELEAVVIRVLSQKGDDHCWRDIYTEMAGLVGMEFTPEVLDKPTMLRNCEHFVDCLLSGEHYVAPDLGTLVDLYIHESLRPDCDPAMRYRAQFPGFVQYYATRELARAAILGQGADDAADLMGPKGKSS